MKQKHGFKIRCLISPLLGIGFAVGVNAQTTVTTSGNEASGSGGTVSSTTGQVTYTTNIDGGGTVAQGVQIPYEIFVVTEARDAQDILLACVVSPNPVSDMLKLTIGGERKDLSYTLYDMSGTMLDSKKIDATETTISMQNLAAATYLIKITDGRQDVKTFKIIKK